MSEQAQPRDPAAAAERRSTIIEVITAIHANSLEQETKKPSVPGPGQSSALTFGEFVPTYLQYLKAKRPKNDGRNQIILTHHLIPYFGHKRLSEIRLEDGLGYLEHRRSEETSKAGVIIARRYGVKVPRRLTP